MSTADSPRTENPDFRDYFPRVDEHNLIWVNYVYAYLVDGLDGVQAAKDVRTQVRLRRDGGLFGMAPRPQFLSLFFPGTEYTEEYRKNKGQYSTGQYNIRLPYFAEDELAFIRKLVWKALKAEP